MRIHRASWVPSLLVLLVVLGGCAEDDITPTDPRPSEPRPPPWIVPNDFDTIGAALFATVGDDTATSGTRNASSISTDSCAA